jgi:hypothetical protein
MRSCATRPTLPERPLDLVDQLAPCRRPDGGPRIDSEWHCLIARAA